MKGFKVLQQYWQLMRTLMFPVRLIRFITIGSLMLAFLGGLLFWWGAQPLLLVLSSAMLFVVITVIGIFMPAQMLSLVSSKQLNWIPGLRYKVFLILFCVYSVISLVIALAVSSKSNGFSFGSVFSAGFSYAAMLAALMLWVCVYARRFAPILFILAWGAYFVVKQFIYIAPVLGMVFGVLIWLVLYIWWCQWRPQEYFLNHMAASPETIRALHDQQVFSLQTLGGKFSVVPRSLYGTLLIGGPDGIVMQLMREVLQMLLCFLSFAVILFFMGDQKQALQLMIPLLMVFAIAQNNFSVLILYYRNLYRVWMLYEGSRSALFHSLEKRFFTRIILSSILWGGVMLAGNFFLKSISIPSLLLIILLLSAVIFSAFLFYMGWIIYRKSEGSSTLLNWVAGGSGVCFTLFAGLILFSWLDGEAINPLAAVSYWLCMLVMLGAVIILRYRVLNHWHQFNFFRVTH